MIAPEYQRELEYQGELAFPEPQPARRQPLLVAVCVRPGCQHRSDEHGPEMSFCRTCKSEVRYCRQYHPMHNTYAETSLAGYQYLRCHGCTWQAESKFRGVEVVCHL